VNCTAGLELGDRVYQARKAAKVSNRHEDHASGPP
jgi:hypothetical protein